MLPFRPQKRKKEQEGEKGEGRKKHEAAEESKPVQGYVASLITSGDN